MKKIIFALIGLTTLSIGSSAAPTKGLKQASNLSKTAAGCNGTTAVVDLDINNVRARMMNGGDMWWDIPTSTAQYEVPAKSKKNSLYAGSIWIGGIDNSSKDVKVAAQTYRQSGNDYWAGPLTVDGDISISVCNEWDKIWKINASEINAFRNIYAGYTKLADIKNAILSSPPTAVTKIIKEWPAEGNLDAVGATGVTFKYLPKREMAPYVDIDSMPGYNWRGGDYPKIVGDQYLWWVFNDKGDVKQHSSSESLNLEIHASAFAFATNDCLNDATFNNYKVFTWGSSTIDSTYMATFSDADLGAAFDDFIGCDTARGLGILYNGDAFDEGGITGYGYDIPMIGIDYFQGPKYRKPGWIDTTISGPDSMVRLKMTSYTFFINGGANGQDDPDTKEAHYYYMTGRWGDGKPFYTSCDARQSAGGEITKFAYTGDPCKGGWCETLCGKTPGDRRFVHSSGPFSMVPGSAPQDITIGAIWVPNVGGGSNACFSKIQVCDDKAQKLFENSFKLPSGPNAPKVNVQPLDNKLVFDLENEANSNNFNEGYGTNLSEAKYREVAKAYAKENGLKDSLYVFEGYIVYQLKSEGISTSEIRNRDGSVNTEKARPVFQCDLKNNVSSILNFEADPQISIDYYIPKLMVDGKNKGVTHSFQLTTDAFATGTSKDLVNYKTYYYLVVAYGYNDFSFPALFTKDKISSIQDTRYIESRTDGNGFPIKVIKAIPHPATDNIYIQNYAEYGTGIKLKRIEGVGNGGNGLILTPESETEALTAPNYHSFNPTYTGNFGPMSLKVVNPDSIKGGDYEVWFDVEKAYTAPFELDSVNNFLPDEQSGAVPEKTSWYVRNITTGDIIYSDGSIKTMNEKYLRKYGQFDWGISAGAVQQTRPGDKPADRENGLISSQVFFQDINKSWLTGIADSDGKVFNNWIRSGTDYSNAADENYNCIKVDLDNSIVTNPVTLETSIVIGNRDRSGVYEKVINGTFAPYNLTSSELSSDCGFGLQYGKDAFRKENRLQEVNSIDIVFTSDKKLWTRCPVIEMTDNPTTAFPVSEGGAWKFTIRRHLGWNGEIDANGKPIYSNNPADSGMSYFPGYAINLETGERLNVSFGEESQNIANNGRDLLFNPTDSRRDASIKRNLWGGKHIIYVSRVKYDEGAAFATALRSSPKPTANNPAYRSAYNNMMWVGIPTLRPGTKLASLKDGIIPTFTRVSIRVTRPYAIYQPQVSQSLRNKGWPLYSFSTKDIVPAKIGSERNKYTNDKDEVLKRIHAVPNPYYAVSEYESNRLDTRIKIINLSEKATIKVYTLDGTLIKTINKNDAKTSFVDWDLKNDKGIPIASGMYLIHVNIPNVGETILKWFGAMRPVDITSF
jgi:hypothetical protein